METTAARRGSPRALWPDVRSIIMLVLNYGQHLEDDPLAILARRDRGAISVYARAEDYHDIIKPRLKAVARWLIAQAGGDAKVFVDTAAVMEKPLAAAAGLGWQGKHTNLVSRQFGSWLFLGAIFTTLELPADAPETDHCGSCRACLDVCPTAAFPSPYRLDARRCISYLTIEHKGPIARELRSAIGNRIFGCDDCLAVCPWNKFAQAGRESKLAAREELTVPRLADLARLDDAAQAPRLLELAELRLDLADGVERQNRAHGFVLGLDQHGLERLLRLRLLLDDLRVEQPLQLPAERFAALARDRRPRESEPLVATEWTAALGPAAA